MMGIMPSGKTISSILVCAAVAVVAAGCTTGVRSPIEQEITKRVTPQKQEFNVDGWTDRTGAHYKLRGRGRARKWLAYIKKWRQCCLGRKN